MALDRSTANADLAVKHRHAEIDGISVFYREAGPKHAPVILLPHGYPSSSFQFRGLMEGLRDDLAWFSKYQTHLRGHRPPTLIAWGPRDGYLALETNLAEVVALVRGFLERVPEPRLPTGGRG